MLSTEMSLAASNNEPHKVSLIIPQSVQGRGARTGGTGLSASGAGLAARGPSGLGLLPIPAPPRDTPACSRGGLQGPEASVWIRRAACRGTRALPLSGEPGSHPFVACFSPNHLESPSPTLKRQPPPTTGARSSAETLVRPRACASEGTRRERAPVLRFPASALPV
jgi:hypothetical protein